MKYIFMAFILSLLQTGNFVSGQSLVVGVVQMEERPDLAGNGETIIKFITEAAHNGCDLVVFPEGTLRCNGCSRDSVYINRLSDEIEKIKKAVHENHIFTVFCVNNLFKPGEMIKQSMFAVDDNGDVVKIYNKLWDQKNYTLPPGTIKVKGIRIGLTLCSDRWIRSTTDLPLIDAPVSIESSWSKPDSVYFPYGPVDGIHWWEIRNPDGTYLDCSPALGPYWIPRAIRNDAYLICAGRRASIVCPDGKVFHCPDKSEQLLVRKIDISGLQRENAKARFQHPVLKSWWDMGTRIIHGEKVDDTGPEILISEPRKLTLALAQMPVTESMQTNMDTIEKYISDAGSENADMVIFPALALTGRPSSGQEFMSELIQQAVERIRNMARNQKIYVIIGSAWKEGKDIFNSAFVIDDKGNLMTRYDQLSAETTIFSAGKSTSSMWFNVKNVHGAVTVGNDIRWEEIAELAASRGAQLLVNIADNNLGKYEEYIKQSFSTFNTFTVFVNACEDTARSSTGNSCAFDDIRRPPNKYHAELILKSDGQPGLFFVQGEMESMNPWLDKMKRLNKSMIPWFDYGTIVINRMSTSSQ